MPSPEGPRARHPACRGRDLGRRLIGDAVAFGCQWGWCRVFLCTVTGLPAATHLYEAAGFRPVKEKMHSLWGPTVTEVRYELVL